VSSSAQLTTSPEPTSPGLRGAARSGPGRAADGVTGTQRGQCTASSPEALSRTGWSRRPLGPERGDGDHRHVVIAALAAAALLVTADPAAAHGVGGRTDLPIPAWQLAWAASFAVAAPQDRYARPWPERPVSAASKSGSDTAATPRTHTYLRTLLVGRVAVLPGVPRRQPAVALGTRSVVSACCAGQGRRGGRFRAWDRPGPHAGHQRAVGSHGA